MRNLLMFAAIATWVLSALLGVSSILLQHASGTTIAIVYCVGNGGATSIDTGGWMREGSVLCKNGTTESYDGQTKLIARATAYDRETFDLAQKEAVLAYLVGMIGVLLVIAAVAARLLMPSWA